MSMQRRKTCWQLCVISAGLLVSAEGRSEPETPIKICVDYAPQYEDGGPEMGDDHLNHRPLTLDAIGARFELRRSADGQIVWSGSLDESTGCTPPILVERAVSHRATLTSTATIRSNTFTFGNERPLTEQWIDLNFSYPGDYPLVVSDSPLARVMAAISFGLSTRNIGISNQSITIHSKPPKAEPCPGTSCNSRGDIYFVVDPRVPEKDHSRFKNVLLHELGHRLMLLGSGLDSKEFRRATDAPGFGSCPGGDGHRRNGSEWQSIAIAEGFAHFYASLALNNPGDGGCASYSHYEVDWDHDGLNDGHRYDCDGPPIPGKGLSTGDYLGTACGGTPPPGTASEFDYQRFFWDLVDKEGLNLRNVVDIIGDANRPNPWNPTYIPSSPDNPSARLAAAARARGFGEAWERQAKLNGVAR